MANATVGVAGYGYGYGYGGGYGYGYGYGGGYGYGSGDGDGYGDGYGYSYGDGYGYGSDTFVKAFVDHPLVVKATSDGSQVVLAVWRSGSDGCPVNGGQSTEPVCPGLIQEVAGPLRICTANALHGTTDPSKWQGDRWWVVALFEPVQRGGDKIASLKRLIVAELGGGRA